jgi:hypothetical protein
MQRDGKLTYDGLRAVLRWSPTGVVAYKTACGGWSVRKDDSVLVNETNFCPRVWKDLDRAVAAIAALGAPNIRVDLK